MPNCVGGVEDDPLFARALLHNARSVSKHPGTETVILVAHGQGADAANQQWLDLLGSLATTMRKDGSGDFRAIRFATWHEDGPEKSETAIKQLRAMVEEAQRDGGRALIVPARINERGAADRYLKGFGVRMGQGIRADPVFCPVVRTGDAAWHREARSRRRCEKGNRWTPRVIA